METNLHPNPSGQPWEATEPGLAGEAVLKIEALVLQEGSPGARGCAHLISGMGPSRGQPQGIWLCPPDFT